MRTYKRSETDKMEMEDLEFTRDEEEISINYNSLFTMVNGNNKIIRLSIKCPIRNLC